MSRKPPRVVDPTTDYAKAVIGGKIIAGRAVRLACQRHLDDLKHGQARGLSWHPERAQHALDFFRDFLVLPDGPQAGQPFELQSWALFTVGSLHGWFNDDGTRRFHFAYVETGKGSGKSPTGCGLAEYAMVADGMAGAQCFVAARARTQAQDSFRDCERILGPDLRARLEVLTNNIEDPETGSYIRPVSSEARSLEGHRVYFALLDEVGLHKNAEVVKAMQRGTKQHNNHIIFAITNSGEDRESIAWELHEKGLKILDGALTDDEFFVYICQLDPCERCRAAGAGEPQDGCADCDNWQDEKVWPKTNPLVGITVPYSYLRKEVRGAIDIPSTESSVRRFNFCAWLRSESRWFTAEQWALCGTNPDDLRGRPAILGLDMSNTNDLTAAVLICPSPGFFAELTTDAEGRVTVGEVSGHVDVMCWTWCPEARVLEQARRGIPYDAWVRAGALIETSGNTIDHRAIRRHIAKLRDDGYWIQEIAYDPAFANQPAQELQDDHGFTVVPIAQDYKTMTEPCMLLETLVMTQRLHHGHAPVLRFAASNVILERDSGGRMRPSKKKSEPNGKIDPMSALVTGLKRLHVLQGMAGVRQEPILGPRRTTADVPW